jgi:hypothetical protein
VENRADGQPAFTCHCDPCNWDFEVLFTTLPADAQPAPKPEPSEKKSGFGPENGEL